jgi:antiviral helicase SKI2
MILGNVAMLESKFRLTYNMILNLLRVEDFKVEDMINRSFSEVQTQREEPKHRALLTKVCMHATYGGTVDCMHTTH